MSCYSARSSLFSFNSPVAAALGSPVGGGVGVLDDRSDGAVCVLEGAVGGEGAIGRTGTISPSCCFGSGVWINVS